MDFKNITKGMNSIEIPKATILSPDPLRHVKEQQKKTQSLFNQIAEEKTMDRANQYRQTEYLKEIRDGIVKMTDVMEVLRINSDHQSEIIEVISDILILSNSQTKEDVSEKFDTILDKLKKFKDNFELFEFLQKTANAGLMFANMKLTGEI